MSAIAADHSEALTARLALRTRASPKEDPLDGLFPSVETPPPLDPLAELLLLAQDVPWRRARPPTP